MRNFKVPKCTSKMQNTPPVIYLDNNATTRTDPRVVHAMLPYFIDHYANASSSHLFGMAANEAVHDARTQVATLIGAKPNEIIFTSGATEAINLALKGFLQSDRKHIVTVATEHRAVLDSCKWLSENGFEITYLPVKPDGAVDLKLLDAAITTDTLLVCIMRANNETGVLHHIAAVAGMAHAKGALLMTDATQAAGKLPMEVMDMGVDLMAFSAHKFHGPKGIGALYVSSRCKVKPQAQQHGGGHEKKLRSGTLNVPGIIGFGKACEIALADMDKDITRIKHLRDHLENELLKIEDTFVNGNIQNRIYNTSNICFKGVNSEKIIMALQNIAVSNGSACSAVTTEPSYVLKAMGLDDDCALASIRFSLGRFTTSSDIEETITKITILVKEFRQ